MLPVGNAGNISAYWMGFKEYADAGSATRRPKIWGVQAAGAAPFVVGPPDQGSRDGRHGDPHRQARVVGPRHRRPRRVGRLDSRRYRRGDPVRAGATGRRGRRLRRARIGRAHRGAAGRRRRGRGAARRDHHVHRHGQRPQGHRDRARGTARSTPPSSPWTSTRPPPCWGCRADMRYATDHVTVTRSRDRGQPWAQVSTRSAWRWA